MRKCSYCKEPSHDIRKCPHKEKHIPLVRECARLFFTELYDELDKNGVGHMSIVSVKNKPHYFFSKEKNEYIYEPNRSFGTGTVGSLYGSKDGSTNTFAVSAMPMSNSGLFGPAFTNAFPILRRMAEKMYYNLWALHNYNEELSPDMKRQKPKDMTDKSFRKMLKSVYSRDKFIELTSLPLAPPNRDTRAHQFSYSAAYHKSDLREREIMQFNTPFLTAASLYAHRQVAGLFRQLEAYDIECITDVVKGEKSTMDLLEMVLDGVHRELSGQHKFLELSENVKVISPSGTKMQKKQKNIDLAIDITEQQWYDIARSFIKEVDKTISMNRRHYIIN